MAIAEPPLPPRQPPAPEPPPGPRVMQILPQTSGWKWLACVILALIAFVPPQAVGQSGSRSNSSPGISVVPPRPPSPPTSDAVTEILKGGPEEWTSPERLSSSLQI